MPTKAVDNERKDARSANVNTKTWTENLDLTSNSFSYNLTFLIVTNESTR